MRRRFVLVAHRAVTAPVFTPKDLAGSGGRMDVVARVLTQSFLTSHGARADTELFLVLLGPPAAPKTLRVRGAEVQRLNPDEHSTAKLLEKALATPTTGKVWQGASPGIAVAQRGLADLRDELVGSRLFVLEEGGSDVGEVDLGGDVAFVIGDDQGFTSEELALLREWGAAPVGLGPVSLHADQCVTVVHNVLDRRA